MTNIKQAERAGLRYHALATATAVLCTAFCPSANASEFDTGNDDLQVRLDNTVRYNFGRRVEAQNRGILGNVNADDGDRNFKKNSTVTNRIDLLTEFDVVYKKQFGARVSAASWYDAAYSGALDNTSVATSNHLVNGAPALGLGDYVNRYYKGASGEWLDAFVFGTFDLGNMQASLRVGRHTVTWGEGLLSGGAVHGVTYGQTPLDLSKAFSTPGVEAKELYRPLNQISGTIQVTPELTLAGQYFLQWSETRLPDGGSYLGFSDALDRGGESLIVGAGPAGLVRARHATDITPKNSGEWGLAARWKPEWLDGTMGFYLRRFSDKLPQTVVNAATGQYLFNYADGIDLYGLSLGKQIAGISFGADLNYRRNMPLISDAVIIPVQAPALPAQGEVLGARGSTVHGVLNALASVEATPLWNSAIWMAELTWNRWLSVSQGANVFKGRDSYTAIDKISKDAFALAVNFTPTWYQVFPGADLSMPLSYSRGLSGNSAVISGGAKDAGSYSLGLGLDLYNKYRFDLRYVDYYGDLTLGSTGAVTVANGPTALLKDRGAVYFTFKTAF